MYVLLILQTVTKMYVNGKIFLLTSEVSEFKRRVFKCVLSIYEFKKIKDKKALTFYPQAPACLFCQPSGYRGMTPQAFPGG